MSARPIDEAQFDNTFTRLLPGDEQETLLPRQVHRACHSPVSPTPVSAPELVGWSREVAELLDLAPHQDPHRLAQIFSGNEVLAEMRPYAACYGGHQFGHWAGQLGDGRAISLGEVVNDRWERWELQLKGAGPTPYSRRGDGRAVLRSSVREFLCSEAMFHLGVPTTRALSLVKTGEAVMRDMFYDGRAAPEPGAIVCRVAPSFLRFGNFEIFTAREDFNTLKRLVDYAIAWHFPNVVGPAEVRYGHWLETVARRTAEMIVHWMRVGFVHGVMNTDNMSILGLTIDYGPYGWLEGYDPNWTPNTTDSGGRRYAFGRQPAIAGWNLEAFANALAPLVGNEEILGTALSTYRETLEDGQRAMMADKLGLPDRRDDDDVLIAELLEVLSMTETDMTIFFRRLADVPSGDVEANERRAPLADAYYQPGEVDESMLAKTDAWLARYAIRVGTVSDAKRRQRMNAVNPKYVLRNYLAQVAIDEAEGGNPKEIDALLEVLRRPYDEQPGEESRANKRPEWARHRAGCSMLSCSS